MYYSSGNYEAFCPPPEARGVDHKSAYLIGTGSGLSPPPVFWCGTAR